MILALRVLAGLACFAAGAAIILGRWGAFWSLWAAAGAFGEAAALAAGIGTLSACVGWLARQHGGVLILLSGVITSLVMWLPYHWRIQPVFFPSQGPIGWDDIGIWLGSAGAYVLGYLYLLRRKPKA